MTIGFDRIYTARPTWRS